MINNPDDGHTFSIAVSLRGSGRVVGDAHDTDSNYFSDLVAVSVRAWNVRDALRQAADLPLRAFFPPEEVDHVDTDADVPGAPTEAP